MATVDHQTVQRSASNCKAQQPCISPRLPQGILRCLQRHRISRGGRAMLLLYHTGSITACCHSMRHHLCNAEPALVLVGNCDIQGPAMPQKHTHTQRVADMHNAVSAIATATAQLQLRLKLQLSLLPLLLRQSPPPAAPSCALLVLLLLAHPVRHGICVHKPVHIIRPWLAATLWGPDLNALPHPEQKQHPHSWHATRKPH